MDRDALDALRMDRVGAEAGARARARPWLVGAGLVMIAAASAVVWQVTRTPPVAVETVTARPANGAAVAGTGTVLNASGYVVARRVATVASKVTGQVAEVLVEEGSEVAQGAVLARLDDSSARAEYALAEGRLETARRGAAELRVRLAEAERTLRRTRELQAERLASQSELDAAEADVAALQARAEVLASEVRTGADALRLARIRLDETVIRAPFAGVVVSKNAQPGETISPMSAGGFTRTGIATVVDMDSLEVEVDVNESFINRVERGQSVEAVLDAYPDWRIPARVISIVPTADRQKATVKVRIGFDALDPRILPEMGVQVWFKERADAADAAARPAAWIPRDALHGGDGGPHVFLARDGRALRRAVQVGQRRGGEVEVTAGLSGGEMVITGADRPLADGVRITDGGGR